MATTYTMPRPAATLGGRIAQARRFAAATGFPAGWFIEGLDAEKPGPRRPGLLVKYAPRDSNPEPTGYSCDDGVQLDLLYPTPEPLHLFPDWN